MSIEKITHQTTSFDASEGERQAVAAKLRSNGGAWTEMPPDYTTFDRELSIRKLDAVYDAVVTETNADPVRAKEAHERSIAFAHRSFDHFNSTKTNVLGREIARAFVVPLRSPRDTEEFASDSIPFYPLLDPNQFGVPADIRMRTIYGVPPTAIDLSTHSNNPNEQGALVFAPFYHDMTNDIRPDRNNVEQQIRLMEVGAAIVRATAILTHERLGAKVVGLGATIPHFTNFGQALKNFDVENPDRMENMVTTTGHGGTVFMVAETVKKILNETHIESEGKIGVIGGAGSIGWSSTEMLLESLPDHQIYSNDRDMHKLGAHLKSYDNEKKIIAKDSILDVLRETNIIVSAVTGTIDLDRLDPEGQLDLQNKVIVDDSQPACFDKGQVEQRGGQIVWVVGQDESESRFMTRDGIFTGGTPYNYGDTAGLYGPKSDFACGLEAAVVAKYAAYDKAITAAVAPKDARAIGRLFLDAGVTVAPFQAFSKPVNIR